MMALVFKTSGGFEQSSQWVRFPYTPVLLKTRSEHGKHGMEGLSSPALLPPTNRARTSERKQDGEQAEASSREARRQAKPCYFRGGKLSNAAASWPTLNFE